MDNIRPSTENYFSNIHMMKIFFRWKWHLLSIAIIAALLAAVFSGSFFIKPKFKSYALVYPSNIAPYSDESESEQMLQWLQSQDIRDSVIRKFDLAAHYRIDSSYKYFQSTIQYLYNKNVKISKTQFESIEIVVMDTDPVIARDMVLAIIDFCNLKIRKIHRDKYAEVVNSMGLILQEKKAQLDSVEKALSDLRLNYELIDYGAQATEITRGYLRTVDGSNSTNINTKDVLRLKENFENKAGQMAILTQRRNDILHIYSEFELIYDRAVYDAEKVFTFTNVVTPPVVADKKSYPVRWLIVLYSVAAALFFSVVVISVIENKRINQEMKDLIKG
ncbi:Wzz/FepE/Etk N-terminal domain-containing protein [Lentimicrobium sp.]|uniref:Wzz/FepE/Etk N-terminal domain-containing protein n=1 Tax=Lentimicrobium sp. TaxID=2034841 RepID=UPI002B97FE3C|nr:Wzz/FepE/Etk N-terminal domain-containing protein [Lentimicrobium sp.]HPF63394.1 Wzz/FepE/Etk N-terminal domain-containing protein [Lentimicrobium sp.]HPJ62205.1 Wzz/FepE/Etk N-terminal domain-containing protein [Lentimicrobium sp.]HPR25998.1 Wzz/FepE/Etk N-terminal domain-containing protein [Lentimicrobium sp.]HRW68996.1 Wzz/FepE/Etk N-terminal domain-containing protein [Lentimicrobium sp.]